MTDDEMLDEMIERNRSAAGGSGSLSHESRHIYNWLLELKELRTRVSELNSDVRLQRLPSPAWAEASSSITQALALLARQSDTGRASAKAAMAAKDKLQEYVNRLEVGQLDLIEEKTRINKELDKERSARIRVELELGAQSKAQTSEGKVNECCENCRFALIDNDFEPVECLRHAPTPQVINDIVDDDGATTSTIRWPEVGRKWWCGEWAPRRKEENVKDEEAP